MAQPVTSAIILAGGKGERLRPFTDDRPKSMVEVAGKPILDYQLDQLVKAGITQIVFTLSYKKEVLQDHIGDGSKYGISAFYSIEETPLGRGGGIKRGMKTLDSHWKDVLILNGDNLWKVDLESLIRKHQEGGAVATVVIVPLKSPYGIVDFNDADQVIGFREKPVLPFWINAGIYVFNKSILDLLPDSGDHETETFPLLPKDKFLVFKSEDYWRAVDTVKDLKEAEKEAAEVFGNK